MPNAMKVFLFALLGGLGAGYVAFRVVLGLPPGWLARPDRLIFAFALALATGVAGAVTAGVAAGKRLRT